MKKTILPLTISTILLFSNSSQASVETDTLLAMLNSGEEIGFNAINHVVITDNVNLPGQGFPSPGDSFTGTGYALIDANIDGLQLTASYSVAGAFTGFDPATGRLFFNHGLSAPGTSNQMTVYLDNFSVANEDDASSYTDGLKIATFDVVPDAEGGYFTQAGGADKLTFKLSDNDRKQLGIEDQDVLFEIETQISLADIVDDHMVFPLFFDAFNCGGTLLDSCGREIGTGKLTTALVEVPVITPPSEVPLPPALGLFLSGLGIMGWSSNKRKSA